MSVQQTDSWCLVVIDMQNDFLHADGYYARRSGERRSDRWRDQEIEHTIANIERLVAFARSAGRPIAFVRAEYDRSFPVLPPSLLRNPTRTDHPCKPGTWGGRLIDPIAHLTHDLHGQEAIIVKRTFDAFIESPLEDFLRAHGVDTVLFTGAETHVCVLVSAQHAALLGFRSYLVMDACWSASRTSAEGALTIFRDAYGETVTTANVIGPRDPAGN